MEDKELAVAIFNLWADVEREVSTLTGIRNRLHTIWQTIGRPPVVTLEMCNDHIFTDQVGPNAPRCVLPKGHEGFCSDATKGAGEAPEVTRFESVEDLIADLHTPFPQEEPKGKERWRVVEYSRWPAFSLSDGIHVIRLAGDTSRTDADSVAEYLNNSLSTPSPPACKHEFRYEHVTSYGMPVYCAKCPAIKLARSRGVVYLPEVLQTAEEEA